MSSYFSSLMQHYGPAEAPFAVMPDTPAPAEDETTATAAPWPQPADPVAEVSSGPTPAPATAADANPFQSAPAPGHFAPPDSGEPHFTPDSDPPAPSEQIITEVTERVIHETVRPAAEDSGTPDELPPVETHLSETYQTDVYLTETHVHEAPGFTPEGEEQTTPEPARPDEVPAGPMPQDDGSEALLGALEAHLEEAFAKLARPQEPPALTIVDEADFEPEGADLPPQLAPEEVREVTREIVKEIHHHHETKVVAEKAPAPRTAEGASQIGPIRLSSHWGAD